MNVETKIYDILSKYNLKITTAESCTGGMVASRLINVAGMSSYFEEGFITYSDKAKNKYLNVPWDILNEYSAVSMQTAQYMAVGVAKVTESDIALSVTGLAGPGGGTDEKQVGLVYIGCFYKGDVKVKKFVFSGDRLSVREQACEEALKFAYERLVWK